MDPLHAISVPQPEFSEAEVNQVLAERFGLQGELLSLVSERDQNFRVVAPNQDRFVFKIANRSEPVESTDFQIKALLHIEQKRCAVPTPRVYRTIDGRDAATIGEGDNAHVCRVVSHLPGELLSGLETTPGFACHFGACAAKLDMALADFEHAGQAQSLLWDMQRASELRNILEYIADAELRSAAESCLDDFDTRILPALPQLRRQVIHGDLHADNVLADDGRISGIIDFGDMLDAPLVVEVAVAAAYLRPTTEQGDVLALVGPFVAGYHSVLPLLGDELERLFDMIRARLVATISIMCWRSATRGDNDEYSSQNLSGESDAREFLTRLNATGRDGFLAQLKKHLKNN